MDWNALRGALFAIALGIAPLAAGCVSHLPLPSDIARKPAVWTGPPLPLTIGIAGVSDRGDRRVTLVSDVFYKSLVNVLRATKIVAGVREIGPAANVAAARSAAGVRDVDLLLSCEIEDFDLYSSYLWWLLYALVFAIPFAGTVSVFIVLLAGAPIASDHALLKVRAQAIVPETGKVVGTYYGVVDEMQPHTLYHRTEVDKSVLSHPEIFFQDACDDIASEIGRDRWWLVKFARKKGAGAKPETGAGAGAGAQPASKSGKK